MALTCNPVRHLGSAIPINPDGTVDFILTLGAPSSVELSDGSICILPCRQPDGNDHWLETQS